MLKAVLEKNLKPVKKLAEKISSTTTWKFDSIDVSPAPGLDASIGLPLKHLQNNHLAAPRH